MSDRVINVAVLGASGRMGQAIVGAMRNVEPLNLSGALASMGNAELGKDAGLSQQLVTGIELTADTRQALDGADVAIDVSLPGATEQLLKACVAASCPLVIGTTGLSDEQKSQIDQASDSIPILPAANFSKGICVLAALLEQVVTVLGPDWDVEITESHHRGKRDAPSGTALALGEQIAAARGRNLADLISYRSADSEPAGGGFIGMRSIREGDTAGEHRIEFCGKGEKLELLHRANDQEAFARGALAAALWLAGREPGLYGMADVFEL